MTTTIQPWGTVYGVGTFRDPASRIAYSLVAADGSLYACTTGNVPITIPLPAGVTITSNVRFVQCFNVVLMLRGPTLPVLQMTNVYTGFADVMQTPARLNPETESGDGTFTIPNCLRGLSANNRLFVIQDDAVLASDQLDYTRFSQLTEMLVNDGSEDRLQNIEMFGKATMICGKEKSVYRVDNVYGNLAATVLSRVTKRYGVAAPDTMVDTGTDFVWLSQEGIASLTLTQQNEVQTAQGVLQGKWPMFSDDIEPLIKRINWQYASGAQAVFNDGKVYFAVPLDAAEVFGFELVQNGPYIGGHILVPNLITGGTYRWEKRSSDTSLTNGTQTLTNSADFIAQGTSVTLAGAGLISLGSLRRVYKGVNNAVLVFDTRSGPNGAWAGHDEGQEITVKQFLVAPYLGRDRLFFVDVFGWVKLYEEDYQDLLTFPYADALVANDNTTVPPNATFRVNDGTLVSSNNSVFANGPTTWASSTLNSAGVALFDDGTGLGLGGYAPTLAGHWTAPNAFPVRLGIPTSPPYWGVRFYALNAIPPIITTTANWINLSLVTRAPIQTTFVTREYGMQDLSLERFNWLYLDLQTLNPSFTVDLLGPGVNRVQNLCSNRTKSRTNYYRPFDKAAYDVTNANGDFLTEGREDYSLILAPAGIKLAGNLTLGLYQEAREPFHFRARARSARIRITNSQGRLRIIALKFQARAQAERGGVSS